MWFSGFASWAQFLIASRQLACLLFFLHSFCMRKMICFRLCLCPLVSQKAATQLGPSSASRGPAAAVGHSARRLGRGGPKLFAVPVGSRGVGPSGLSYFEGTGFKAKPRAFPSCFFLGWGGGVPQKKVYTQVIFHISIGRLSSS